MPLQWEWPYSTIQITTNAGMDVGIGNLNIIFVLMWTSEIILEISLETNLETYLTYSPAIPLLARKWEKP